MGKNYDTRDLEIRLNELQSEFTTWKDGLTLEQLSKIKDKYETPDDEEISDEEFAWGWEDEVGSDADELKNLVELRDEIGSPWDGGVYLISEDNFTEHAEQLAEDIGAIERSASWPCNYIDWNRAAEDLKNDYSTVDYDGETYYYRA